jgi:hypothetical protein
MLVTHWILWKPTAGVGIWDQVPATVEPSGDAWHQFAVIFDRAAGKYDVYVDGVRKAQGIPGIKAAPGDVQWIIGHQENPDTANADNFRGMLDDVRIYNRLITPKEVQALYQLGNVTPPSLAISRSGNDLVISWPAEVTGFVLESAGTLPAASWTPVSGVSGNTVRITPTAGPTFYRLRK